MTIGRTPFAHIVRLSLAMALLLGLDVGGTARAQDQAAPTVAVVQNAGFGAMLADPDGWTLYQWGGDADGVSNCYEACATAWPPDLLGDDLVAPDGLPGSLGFIDRGDGTWQVTYDNWPLYYFSGDAQPGDTNGDGRTAFGARWSAVVVASAPAVVQPPVVQPPVVVPTQVIQPTPVPTFIPPVFQPTAQPTPARIPPSPTVPPTSTPILPGGNLPSGAGPQFPNFGPGSAPPAAEGLGPSTGGAYGVPNGAAPYAAPAPGAVAPVPPYGGCQHDLRGSWWNQGQQTAPTYRPYAAYVNVRQYNIWIQGTQDDGTGYYGQCIGNQLQLDVYQGYRFVGRQYGTITGNYYPQPLYPDVNPPYAAPPPPYYGGGVQANFTWTAYYGTGTETWTRR